MVKHVVYWQSIGALSLTLWLLLVWNFPNISLINRADILFWE